jgi:DNA-binding beta-propeller fold protein YncE
MKSISCLFVLLTLTSYANAQRPDRELLPLNAYALEGYAAVDVSESFTLPAGFEFERVSSIGINSLNNMLVLHRGEDPLLEFDAQGNYLRAFGPRDTWTFSHGLRLDAQNNIWVTDIGTHIVMKMDTDGNILQTLGTAGENGLWDEASGSHKFDQPNDIAFDSEGNFYIAQGHGNGEPRILKFDSDGNFIKQWGSRGAGPGQFAVAHSIEIDNDDMLYVADRENFRIQIFDTEGNYTGEWKFSAMACALYFHDDGYMYMTSGFDGEWAKVDMEGSIVGALGRPGSANGEFGEGHFLTVNNQGDVYIADVVNRRVQLYQKQ